LGGEACALVADGVLRDLHENAVAGLECELDATGLVLAVTVCCSGCGIPVHFAGVEHGVATATDVDERGLHAREDVLDTTEVDVADKARLLGLGDVVLDENGILEDGDLDAIVLGAHDHLAVDALAASEELALRDDGATTTGVAAVAA